MDRRIDAHIARTQFGQIMDLATKNNERFIVDRRGEPAVVIMSVQDFIRTVAPPPDWLRESLERRQAARARHTVNAGEKMHQRAGVKRHHGGMQMPPGTAFAARQTE